MLTRDFVRAFLIGQVSTGLTEEEAKTNFTSWLMGSSMADADDKEKILSDLSSYSVKG